MLLLRLPHEFGWPRPFGFPDVEVAPTCLANFNRTRGLDYRYNQLGRRDWDTLLVVLGRPVETLSKPQKLPGTDARYRERKLQRASKPYDPHQD